MAVDCTPIPSSLVDLHRAWTLCSYATTEHRHDAKRHLNQMILNWLASKDVANPVERPLTRKDRPTLLVACEVIGGGHVMSRCYEPFLEQLKERFHVVTIVAESDLGDETVPWSDELVQFSWNQERFADILEIIQRVKPDAIYYPCVGMRLWTVIACNLRLAPLQIASLGHPATTNSQCIDFMVGGKTTSGDGECYSERLVRLASPGNLYRLNRGQESYPREVRGRPAPVRIAVCANMLKLNSDFLDACGTISDRAERSIEFCFMPNCIGLKYLVARQQVTARLARRARFLVAPRNRCADYLQNLAQCDLYFSPFPFGGENSTLDALLQALPVVTLAGKQPHSQLDARVMETIGLPPWLITGSPEEYIDAAVRLINEDETRVSITQQLLDTDIEQRFTEEHATYANDFVNTFWSIYETALADAAS
jgi:predicted O-linked N-acetylglucosamine transferase (SPINDLY family)